MFPARCANCGLQSPRTAEEITTQGWRSFNIQEVVIGCRAPFGPVQEYTVCPSCVLELTLFGPRRVR